MAKPKKNEGDGAPEVKISPVKLGISLVLVGVLLYLVFFHFLPGLIDYDQVWKTIQSLTSEQIFWLFVLGTIRLVIEGWAYVPTLKNLRVWQGTLAYNTSTAWANVIPIPLDMPIRWKMYRTWGFQTDKIILSFPLSGIFTIAVKLILPVVSLGFLLFSGSSDNDWILWGFIIGLVALVVLIVVVYMTVRSAEFAKKLARWTKNAVEWVVSKFNKTINFDYEKQALELRDAAIEVLGHRWFEEFLATLLAQLMQVLILAVSLRMVGVGEEVVSTAEVFLAYSISQLILLIPITPGGMGVAEASYIHFLTQASGGAMANEIGAAVFLFRIVTWLYVVPAGLVSWGLWRLSLRHHKFAETRYN